MREGGRKEGRLVGRETGRKTGRDTTRTIGRARKIMRWKERDMGKVGRHGQRNGGM